MTPGSSVPFVVVSCDFVKTGGMDRANHALVAHMAHSGLEVHAVGHSASSDLAQHPAVTFHPVSKPLKSYLLGEPFLNQAGKKWASQLTHRGARTIVNGGNCAWGDVNWVHYVHAAYTPQNQLGAAQRMKHAWSHRAFLKRERKALGAARLIIANSHRTRRDLIEKLGLPENHIHVIYYGIDPDQFRPASDSERAAAKRALNWPQDRPTVIFIGALGDRRKGFDILFNAWKSLCADKAWNVDLAVVGAGAELSDWQRRAVESGLHGRIRFLGFRRDVPEVLKACDLLIAPTRYEAYGLGVHEALCCGLPAMVSASAGVAERYPDALRDLLLPDNITPDDLAARLRSWAVEIDARRRQMEAFAGKLRSYSWSDMGAAIMHLIEQGNRPAPKSGVYSER